MSFDPDHALDPTTIAGREFSSSFRGYDAEEVREYLRLLSDRLRTELAGRQTLDRDSARVAELLTERTQSQARIDELQAELAAVTSDLSAMTARAEEAEAAADPTTWDEAKIDELVGSETAHVLASARSAAAGIRSRAEADAEARMIVAEERQRTTELEIAELRASTTAELNALRSSAEQEAAALETESRARTVSLVGDAEKEAAATRSEAERDASATQAAAAAAAEQLVTAAQEAAETARAEAEADVIDARDRVREEARLMLAEAQSVRERVLADLVKRRRTGRTQLDQIKAARDRMARSLALVRRDLDEAIDELAASVPEARAAMEEVGRAAQVSTDEASVEELARQLDRQAARTTTLLAEAALQPSGGGTAEEDPEESDAVAAPDEAKQDESEHEAVEPEAVVDEPGVDAVEAEDEPEAVLDERGVDEIDAADDEPEAVFDERDVDEAMTFEPDAAGPEVDEPEAVFDERDVDEPDVDEPDVDEPDVDEPDVDPVDEVTSGRSDIGALFAEINAESPDAGGRSRDVSNDDVVDEMIVELQGEAGDGVEVPLVFTDRDVAMTRYGPALRRQLKRALADDQSDVLDRVRRAKKQMAIEDLPPIERQILTYIDAGTDSIQAAARAGAEAAGGRVKDESVSELVETLARSIAESLRYRVERSITWADGDTEEVLEPIRANYRNARADDLPKLADDAMAEAFAIGVYEALAKGTNVVWLADPRHPTDADCHDNSLAGPIPKPAAFPTGHRRPLGGPGCRCLVVAEDQAAG